MIIRAQARRPHPNDIQDEQLYPVPRIWQQSTLQGQGPQPRSRYRLLRPPSCCARVLILGGRSDLAYITDNVIVMGYPAAGLEGLYRNRREDAKKFLQHRHGNNFWIFNVRASGCPAAYLSLATSLTSRTVLSHPRELVPRQLLRWAREPIPIPGPPVRLCLVSSSRLYANRTSQCATARDPPPHCARDAALAAGLSPARRRPALQRSRPPPFPFHLHLHIPLTSPRPCSRERPLRDDGLLVLALA